MGLLHDGRSLSPLAATHDSIADQYFLQSRPRSTLVTQARIETAQYLSISTEKWLYAEALGVES